MGSEEKSILVKCHLLLLTSETLRARKVLITYNLSSGHGIGNVDTLAMKRVTAVISFGGTCEIHDTKLRI